MIEGNLDTLATRKADETKEEPDSHLCKVSFQIQTSLQIVSKGSSNSKMGNRLRLTHQRMKKEGR